MGISLNALNRETRTVTVPVGDGLNLELSYYPNAYTPELEEKAAQAQSGQFAGRMLIAMLAPVIASWNLEDNGSPLPVSEDTLRMLPMRLLTQMLQEIGEDLNPQKASASASVGSS